jgi:hypothetical protein
MTRFAVRNDSAPRASMTLTMNPMSRTGSWPIPEETNSVALGLPGSPGQTSCRRRSNRDERSARRERNPRGDPGARI